MKTRLDKLVLILNLMVLVSILAYGYPAETSQAAALLRGSGLEIVDDHGRVRAQIILLPASSMPDGKNYPETTLLRLIDTNGRPAVKIGGSVDGSGMGLFGNDKPGEWSGVQILVEGTGTILRLLNKDGHEQLLRP